ncbi:MAG TPA: GTPase [Desulfomonilaceae bacterium]|nr:GTPase [Desulfomonilaceae bacterium]
MATGTEIHLHFDERLMDYAELQTRLFEANRLLKAYACKCSLGNGFPLITCLVGGTGTGKSTLFNSLTGRKISDVGTRRPYTLRAVVLAHEDAIPKLADCPFFKGDTNEAVIVSDRNPDSAALVLVDTPDFDSVEVSNRVIAENFFIISDVLVFVTSQEKYGDLAGHRIGLQARAWGKKIVFVMNKAASDAAFDDFRCALAEKGYTSEPIRIERIQPPPDVVHGLRERPEFRELMQAGDREEIRSSELEKLRNRTRVALEELHAAVEAQAQRIALVIERIHEIFVPVSDEMDSQLHAIVSQDMEAQIRDRLQKLLRKYDILFGPRMMVRNMIKKAILAFAELFTSHQVNASQDTDFREEDFLETRATVKLKPLESALAALNLHIAHLLASDPAWEDLRQAAREEVPRWDSGEIQKQYDEAFPGIEHLLEIEFERLRHGLSFSDELKLYGSYTLWALLLITAEIAVGGGFSLLDVFLDTVIVPLIPKWLLNLKVLDVLREVGERVDRTHRDTLRNILVKQADLYTDRFTAMLPSSDEMSKLDALIKEFANNRRYSPVC